jgi:DNA-binding NtrC family response regulator
MWNEGSILFAIVDPKDPFMGGELEGEDQPGPILSVAAYRPFERLFLFHTPGLRENAEATQKAVANRHPGTRVALRPLPVSDPKDYSALMGCLTREVRGIRATLGNERCFVCVSSGTAEMRAAWFLMAASGILPATLLQVGSPAEPLFSAANVKEVDLRTADWDSLRDLMMPAEYFDEPAEPSFYRLPPGAPERVSMPAPGAARYSTAAMGAPPAEPEYPELDAALRELGISIGSAVMRYAAERAAVAAGADHPILLLGETGTGKEMFARLIHRLSPRRSRELVPVNCAAIPKDLVESHLFGHVKGAFTGATAHASGRFQRAGGGILFLDEIGELPLEAQAKLLRVLQDGCVEPVGAARAIPVDVAIVAATNRDLAAEVAAGRFREDLYYRLEVIHIVLPPLRERRAEIPQLAVAMLQRINQRRMVPKRLSKEALQRLESHDWPGNVRELSNVLERSVLYARGDVLAPEDMIFGVKTQGSDPLSHLPEPGPGFSLELFLAQARRQLILRALAKTGGQQKAAGDLLGLSRQAISKFLKEPGHGRDLPGSGGNPD